VVHSAHMSIVIMIVTHTQYVIKPLHKLLSIISIIKFTSLVQSKGLSYACNEAEVEKNTLNYSFGPCICQVVSI